MTNLLPKLYQIVFGIIFFGSFITCFAVFFRQVCIGRVDWHLGLGALVPVDWAAMGVWASQPKKGCFCFYC